MNTLIKDGFASTTFDYIRFIAAFAVLLGHGISRFFGFYDENTANGILEKVFRVVLSGYGSHGVTVFFVLSGFFIGLSFFKQYNSGNFRLSNYILRRWV
ncbi:acyltransferase [Alishewanella sp. WH16-1]|uniref:acyltransferase family protein n=1 Tax=Alishewanella sp. WH16-1 TaxID=1651088 RepID=UPI0009E7C9D2|nr:acyltransferase family protein [Alishewanella sp. WH16-1]